MGPYALQIRAGVGRLKAGGSLAVCTQERKCCLPGPHPDPLQSRFKGILARILQGPPMERGTGCVWQTMLATQCSLCAGVPLRRLGRNHLRRGFLLGGLHGPPEPRPRPLSGAQRGPGLTAEGRQGSWVGRGILFSLSAGPQPSVPETAVAGKARGTGAAAEAGGR